MIHTSYTCPSCQKTSFPSFILADKGPRAGKLVAQCPNEECLRVDNGLGPEHFNAGVAAIRDESRADGEGWSGKKQIVIDTSAAQPAAVVTKPADPPEPVRVVATSPVVARAPEGSVNQTFDVVTLMQQKSLALATEEARLVDVIAQAKLQLDATKAERKRIDKMLAVGRRDQARAAAANIDITNLRN